MKKFTQVLSLCLAGGLFLFSSPAVAEDCCQWDGCWDLGAELLYWRPCICDWVYGRTDITVGTDRQIVQKTLKMSPDFGFRVFGVYNSEDGCNFTTVSWTYLRATDASRIGPDSSVNISVSPFSTAVNKAEVSQKDEYNRVYLRVGHYLCQSQCVSFYTYAGIEYIDIDQKRTIEALTPTGTTPPFNVNEYREKSEFYAFGFDLGIGGEYEIGCGFNLNAQVGAIAAIGRRKHRHNRVTNNLNPRRTAFPSRIDCVPGAEARLGINYVFSCGCSDLHVEIGYALEHYFNVLAVSTPAESGFADCEDVGFAGPYAKFQFRF